MSKYIIVNFGQQHPSDGGETHFDYEEFDSLEEAEQQQTWLGTALLIGEGGMTDDELVKYGTPATLDVEEALAEVWDYTQYNEAEDGVEFKKEFDDKAERFLELTRKGGTFIKWGLEYDVEVAYMIKGDWNELRKEGQKFLEESEEWA